MEEDNKGKIESLRVGKSFTTKHPELEKYASRLSALDKNKDGYIQIEEVCAVIDQVVEAERHSRFFKWAAILAVIVSILAVAASAGLTYAVVVLSKDYKVTDNVFVSKTTGEALQTQLSDMLVGDSGALLARQQGSGAIGTAAVVREQGLDELLMHLSTTDPNSEENRDLIAQIQSVTVPNAIANSPYAVWHVAEAAPLSNGSLYIRSTAGNAIVLNADGTASLENGGRRRLLDTAGAGVVRYALGTKDLPRGINRRWDAWFVSSNGVTCDSKNPITGSNGKCAPCTQVIDAGAACFPGVKGTSAVVCASTGMCLDTRDRMYISENGVSVAGSMQCRYLNDLSKLTLIPEAKPQGSDAFPCFPCYYKNDAGLSCFPNSDDSAYVCQENGRCVRAAQGGKKKNNL